MPKPEQFAHVQEFIGPSPEVREFSNELLAAIGQVAKDYAMEPYEILKRFDKLRRGEQPRVLLDTGVSYPLGSRQLATDVAMQAMGGGLSARLVASPPAGSMGIMGGGKAYTKAYRDVRGVASPLRSKYAMLVRQRKAAEYMLKDIPEVTLQDAERIRRETGWFKPEWYTETMSTDKLPTGDSGWRFEISDKDFDFSEIGKKLLKNFKVDTKVGDVVNHPKLFEAYPELRKTRVKLKILDADHYGTYEPANNRIILNSMLDRDTMRYTMLHELQHVVQDIEGHHIGTSPMLTNEEFRRASAISDAYALLERGQFTTKQHSGAVRYQREAMEKMPESERMKMVADARADLAKAEYTPEGFYRAHRGEQESRDVELRFRLHKMAEEHGVDAGDVPPYAAITSWVNPNTNEVLRVEYRKPSTPTEVGEIHAWNMDAPE